MSRALVEWEGLGGPLGRRSGGLEPWREVQPGMGMGLPADRQQSLLVPNCLGNRGRGRRRVKRGVWVCGIPWKP